MAKFTKIVRRSRQDDEIPTPKVAIRNHCLSCMGWNTQEVELCTAKACWLYSWRQGTTPLELKKARRQK